MPIDHFKHGAVNGSIFKYIYPNGQCQGKARAIRVMYSWASANLQELRRSAYTQGTDLFSMAENRIALGFEYTARFLTGRDPILLLHDLRTCKSPEG